MVDNTFDTKTTSLKMLN